MTGELRAALLGAAVGSVGSLAAAWLGAHLQFKSLEEQLKVEREMHKEQISIQMKIFEDSTKRDNDIRVIELLLKDIENDMEMLKEPNLNDFERQKIINRINLLSTRRSEMMRAVGLDPGPL